MIHYQSWMYDSARWNGFAFRPDDIVISTPPKCGTTWTQRICALLIFQTDHLDQPLSITSPWLDQVLRSRDEVIADLEAQRHRRFIKTHTPLDGLPWDDRVTYIGVGRDPRDVGVSMGHHRENMDMSTMRAALDASADTAELPPAPVPAAGAMTEHEQFWRWADDPSPPTSAVSSLFRTVSHLQTFWVRRERPNVVLLHYDDLLADLDGQMAGLAEQLGIDLPEDRRRALARAATFDQMRDQADQLAPNASRGMWHDNQQFFARGTSGQWRQLLDDDDLERYQARIRDLIDPDLSEWLHRGPVVGRPSNDRA